jgi:hypothetical protein
MLFGTIPELFCVKEAGSMESSGEALRPSARMAHRRIYLTMFIFLLFRFNFYRRFQTI